MTSGINVSKTDLHEQVLAIFREPANVESEHGVHIDEIVKRFKLPEKNIRDAIDYNVDIGHIYSTIHDFHYKSAFTD
uniref:Pco076382 n=1 Tax=Arundo donax TaxID=35708 RepID=A0A0A9E411_ARUDO